VAKVTETLVVKYGQHISLPEVAAILYVSAYTSIPVPQIHGAYEYKSELFLFMEFIPGRTLKDALPDMTAASKDALTEQLRVHMNSLRSLRGTYIGGLGCTPCFDHIFADEPPSDYGPFPNVAAFHETLAKAINRYGVPEGFPTSRSKCRLFKDDYRIVFSHGDFASRNIMLSEEEKLAAILDWETAGFWPEYWEWMKA
ncbi:kinase-like domain-containing protein, partial [Sparassis latifolia]